VSIQRLDCLDRRLRIQASLLASDITTSPPQATLLAARGCRCNMPETYWFWRCVFSAAHGEVRHSLGRVWDGSLCLARHSFVLRRVCSTVRGEKFKYFQKVRPWRDFFLLDQKWTWCLAVVSYSLRAYSIYEMRFVVLICFFRIRSAVVSVNLDSDSIHSFRIRSTPLGRHLIVWRPK